MEALASAIATISKALQEAGPYGIITLLFVACVLIYKDNIKKSNTILQMATEQLKVNMEMLPTLRDLASTARASAEREHETTKALTQIVDTLKEMKTKIESVDSNLTLHCDRESRRNS